jgi:hypothetical protein
MTRQHFKAIAEAIKLISNEKERTTICRVLLPMLRCSNDRFDANRFCEAAGVDRHDL